MQSLTLGYDGVLEVLPMNMTYANAASVHETSTAEMTLALILASQRAIPEFVRAAMAGTWSPTWRQSLADRSVLLVGYGGVGRAIEARLLPFETTVHRLARHERNDERGIVYGLEYLSELLPFSDIVVVAVPLDAEYASPRQRRVPLAHARRQSVRQRLARRGRRHGRPSWPRPAAGVYVSPST